MYNYNEALEASTQYFNQEELPANIFIGKYALRNELDELVESTPDDLHWREAHEFARVEAKKFKNPMSAQEIHGYLKNFKK